MYSRHVGLLILCASLSACGKKELPELPSSVLPEPLPANVESVVFIVGDMGAALWERSPMPRRMERDVEWWSRALARDSAVSVIFLGDNVYPKGIHDQTDPLWPADSAHMEAQVRIVAGPNARAHRAFGAFVAGNHDWGNLTGEAGEQRIKNQQDFLTRRRQAGIQVRLLPPNVTSGPGIIDIGRSLRILMIDTAWWLLSADDEEKQRIMQRLERGMREANGRHVMIAAHHPMRSASSHGGLTALWKAFGVRWLLNRSGAALQDLNSLPYRDFLNRLNEVFERVGPPLIFAGGHDHALQVIRGANEKEPPFIIVSGAGSKSSEVGHTAGMQYRSREPGFMKLVMLKDGGVQLFVYTAPPGFLMCAETERSIQEQCVEAGAAEFSLKFAIRLK